MADISALKDMRIHKIRVFSIQKIIDISCDDSKLRYIDEFQRFVNGGLSSRYDNNQLVNNPGISELCNSIEATTTDVHFLIYHRLRKPLITLVRYLGHLGSATLAAGAIAAMLQLTPLFRTPFFLGALFGGAIMGFLVNRNARDLTALLVWIVPLAWLIYGIRDSTASYSQAWAHQSRSAYVWDNFFGTRCSGSECLDELLFTTPFLSSISYSVTSYLVSRKASPQPDDGVNP
jgi:hypothetical protein